MVSRIQVRYKRTGRADNRVRSGRPSMTTKRQRKHFSRLSMINPFSSSRQLMFVAIFENHISLRTAKRILCNSGLFRRIATRKQLMNKNENANFFCKTYRQMPAFAWKGIIFTDEMKLEVVWFQASICSEEVWNTFPQSVCLQNSEIRWSVNTSVGSH